MATLSVKLGALALRNPVLAASGTFGFGLGFEGLVDLSAIGGVVLKSLTVEPRAGNPPPRVAETPAGMVNSIGLENPGLRAFLAETLPSVAGLPTVVIASVAGERVDDFVRLAGALDPEEAIDALEVNVSCPNQAAGGMAFGADPTLAAQVVRAVRRAARKPVLVKLTPACADLGAVAQAAEAEGADALTVANTFPALPVDWRRRRPAIAGIRGRGGLSGPAVKPMALRLVQEAYRRVKIPIVASGGIVTADDAMEFVVAGATAVQVGTATFLDPRAPQLVAEGLARLLDSTSEPDLHAWIGTLKA
ncbi:MAG: dihydroorotate dehydrogenase [Planctomycetes bacterium]|nr:dihydroorotate dehydrogenase [Planctomycetota bacterium]